jgi:hypothetical protein
LSGITHQYQYGEPDPQESDLLFCTTDGGLMVIVGWDTGLCDGHPISKPGLRVFKSITIGRPGKSMISLGHFVKVSSEYTLGYAEIVATGS